jgi:hypothetical protein
MQEQSVGLTPEDVLEREYTPEVRSRSYETITLERMTNRKPTKPWLDYRLGSIFTYTYKSMNHEQALLRAVNQLKAQGEDPLHWSEVK